LYKEENMCHWGWGFAGSWLPGGYGGGFGINWFTPIVTIIVLGLVIWAVVALLRRGRIQPVSGGADAALEILNRRYAQGEVNKEEYEQKKKDLR
jgi:putative membrane protein